MPQGEHLQHTLTGEEDDKHQVDPVKDVLHLLALCVCLHHHGHHVEADEHHDDYIKSLLSYKVKDSSLNTVLCKWGETMIQTGLNTKSSVKTASCFPFVNNVHQDIVFQNPLRLSRHPLASNQFVYGKGRKMLLFIIKMDYPNPTTSAYLTLFWKQRHFQIVLLIQVSQLINTNHSCSILTFLRSHLDYNDKNMVMCTPAWVRTKAAFGAETPLKVYSAVPFITYSPEVGE